jgi:hypothetical protein
MKSAGSVGGRKPRWGTRIRVIVLVGALIRLYPLFVQSPAGVAIGWRQADLVQVARSFDREGMNILYPRVDWRGDGSGYAEMEFPAIPWVAATMHRAFGYNENHLVWVSVVIHIVALVAFAGLGAASLDPRSAGLATALFAVHPLVLYLDGSFHPEDLVLLFSILHILFVTYWLVNQKASTWIAAAVCLGCAILSKAPAAGYLLAFGGLSIIELRRGSLKPLTAGAAIAVAVGPSAAWYVWAHQLYLQTGLSLGVTNARHLISVERMMNPVPWVRGNLTTEILWVFLVAGVVFFVATIRRPGRGLAYVTWLYGSALIFYLLAAHTSGDRWAFYYHILSVPPVILLVGSGYGRLRAWASEDATKARRRNAVVVLVCVMLFGAGILGSVQVVRVRGSQPTLSAMRLCLERFSRQLPPSAKVALRGGGRTDEHGYPVAYNESMGFVWLDHKGVNYPAEDLSVATLHRLSTQGIGYWIANIQKDFRNPLFSDSVRASFRVCDSCANYMLLDLNTEPGGTR